MDEDFQSIDAHAAHQAAALVVAAASDEFWVVRRDQEVKRPQVRGPMGALARFDTNKTCLAGSQTS